MRRADQTAGAMAETMAEAKTARPPAQHAGSEDDSPVTVLRQLLEERGRLFTEAEYQEFRRAVLDELAMGARLRPFTLFTFLVLELGLAGLLVVGIRTGAGGGWGDHALALISAAALISGGGFFWTLWDGVRKDQFRTLDERLRELDELRGLHLVSPEEYHHIQSHILHQRQRSGRI